MPKMWDGRFTKEIAEEVNDFNSSIGFDKRLYEEDIKGSLAHAAMLAAVGIISYEDHTLITDGLTAILNDLKDGKLKFDMTAEDIHMFIEAELTKRIGDAGKRLHTARSRNDQVALDMRMYAAKETDAIIEILKSFVNTLVSIAEKNTATLMPGYTHLQQAQPVTLAEHMLAYCAMFLRDISRLNDNKKRTLVLPLGACALAGTTFPIDRQFVKDKLNFNEVGFNSMDCVSDRDFVIELLSDLALIMVHVSRLAEEVILWSSAEFKFIELDDAYATGSSIMPNKKNPDVAELARGKSGRVIGDLMGMLTVMKGIPLAYNKDMQEDKEQLFDAIDTVKQVVTVFNKMLATATFLKDNMAKDAEKGFINATDCADYLVKKGLPFRTAYKIVGSIIGYCIKNGKVLTSLTLDEYKEFSELFENDVYEAVDLNTCLNKRTSEGAPSVVSVEKQIKTVKGKLN